MFGSSISLEFEGKKIPILFLEKVALNKIMSLKIGKNCCIYLSACLNTVKL